MARRREESEKEATKSTQKSRGCAILGTLIGTVLLGSGISLMQRWDAMGGGAKSGAVILVVLGTLVLLPFVLVFVLKIAFTWWMGKLTKDLKKGMEEMMAAGGDMVAGNKAMYEKIHTFRVADDEEDFEDIDRSAYDAAQRELSSLGFRHLGDVVDETIEELTGVSPVIRIMASTDGTTVSGFYHFTPPQMPRGFGGKELLMCDLGTEFTDGTFLATANSQGLDLTTAATGIDRRQHPLETPIGELVRQHEADKQKLLAAKAEAGTRAVTINTLDDALESEKRQQALKNAFRKQIGYVDPEEVRRIAKNVDDDEDFGDMAARAADEARKKERGNDE